MELSGDKKVQELPVAAQQMVEIAKAISRNARLILMDEPTSALSSKEVVVLLNLMRRLKEKGVSVVFVSHRLDEVLQVVDRMVVMRDGKRVGELSGAEATEGKIIRLMVGREVGLFPKQPATIGEPALQVENLSGSNGVRNVSLTVHRGEIVGLAGLIGAGRTEVVRLICGADKLAAGQVWIHGKRVSIKNPGDAVKYGIGWIPEDRKNQGLVLGMDVKQNTTMAILKRISNVWARYAPIQSATSPSSMSKPFRLRRPAFRKRWAIFRVEINKKWCWQNG